MISISRMARRRTVSLLKKRASTASWKLGSLLCIIFAALSIVQGVSCTAETRSSLVKRYLQSCVALRWRSFSEKNPPTQASARAYVEHAANWNEVAKLDSGASHHSDVCLKASEQRRVALQVLGVHLKDPVDLYWTRNSGNTMPHHNPIGITRLRATPSRSGRTTWTFIVTESRPDDSNVTRPIGHGEATVIIYPRYVRLLDFHAAYAKLGRFGVP